MSGLLVVRAALSRMAATSVFNSCVGCIGSIGLIASMAWFAPSGGAHASEIVIDEAGGATFAGLVDGFPGVFPHDGVPDAPDLLGVGYKAGVTEERGIGEFPLDGLEAACLAPGDISRATLTFNIDDVLSSFGPGTEFNGEASSEILIHPFPGNGLVGFADPGDFQHISAAPYTVDTTSAGVITDASLVSTGPISFTVDVTDSLTAELGGGSHLGFVWRTPVSPTGTSLDNLGDMAQGPPGVDGATLPFLTVTTTSLHLGDLRCEGGIDTVCSWEAEAGDVAYDVVRGDLSALSQDALAVDLGVVVCIEDDSADLSTLGDADAEQPLPGEAFFYLMRPATDTGPGSYGRSSDCKERLPLVGGCG